MADQRQDIAKVLEGKTIRSVRYDIGDYMSVEFTDGSTLDLFPSDYGGTQGSKYQDDDTYLEYVY